VLGHVEKTSRPPALYVVAIAPVFLFVELLINLIMGILSHIYGKKQRE
jgi:hypothetical protein